MAAKKTTWEQYQNSGYYNSSGVAALQEQANQYTTDRDKLTAQAQAQLQAQYAAQQRAIQQQTEAQQTALSNQLTGLEQTYDQQRRAANSQYDQSGSAAMNALTKRGLGRSSVVGDTMGDLESARNQTLADIGAKQSDTVSDIRNNMALASQQSAAALAGLASDLAAQVTARTNELYDTNLAAQTSLQAQIAAMQQQGYQAYMNWYYAHGPGKKKSSSHKTSNSTSNKPSTAPATNNNLAPTEYVDNFGKDRY